MVRKKCQIQTHNLDSTETDRYLGSLKVDKKKITKYEKLKCKSGYRLKLK